MKLLPLSFALLTACAPPEPDFRSSYGTAVYLNGHQQFTRPLVDSMEEALVQGLSRVTGYEDSAALTRCVAAMKVEVFDLEVIAATNPQTRPAGLQFDSYLQVGAYECPRESAYLHEAAHWLQQCATYTYDPNHTLEPGVWLTVNMLPSGCL